jgi:LysM repeat protein
MKWLKALAAVVLLAAVAVLPPVLLVIFVGDPMPGGLRFDAPLSNEALIKLLSVLVWVLWAQTLGCIGAEAVAAARSTHLTRVPGTFGVQQQLARVLIGAIITVVVALPVGSPSAAATTITTSARPHEPTTSPSPAPALDTPAAPSRAETHTRSSRTIEVQRGDTLWAIAATHLGQGDRWEDIAGLNEGHVMNDDRTFHASEALRPGWLIRIPDTATNETTAPLDAAYTVEAGDTLSQIALDQTGDANAWPDLFAASRKLNHAVPLTDPDLIYPGQQIAVPHATSDSEQRSARPPNDVRPRQGAAGRRPAHEPPARAPDHTGTPPDTGDAQTPTSPRAVEGAEAPLRERSTSPATDDRAHPADNGRSHPDPHDQMPGWITPGLTAAGALLAGSLLLTLRARRATQHRFRRPGRTLGSTDPALTGTEQSITVAGGATHATVELLDHLLRELATQLTASGEPLPVLAAVEITATVVALHLREPSAAPPPPWAATDDGLAWVTSIPASPTPIDPGGAASPAPWPLLVAIGHDDPGSTWLLNLENLHVRVTGDREARNDFARFVAAEIACNPWSQDASLDLVGVGHEVVPMSPARIHAHDKVVGPARDAFADAIHTIDRLADYQVDLTTARGHQVDPDSWPARALIVAHHDTTPEMDQLTHLLAAHPRRTGVALVTIDSAPTDGFTVVIDHHRRLTAPAAKLSLTAVGLTSAEAHGCAALLAQADTTTDQAIPDLTGDHAWQSTATAAGSLRQQYRTDRASTPRDPSASLLDRPDHEYTSVAATTEADLDALAPKVTTTVRDQIAHADPALDDDLDEWFSDHCVRPRLSLLGPVAARASGPALDKRKPFYTELFAYLATRPFGATTDEVATAFDLTGPRVRTDINKLRDWLGVNPATGQKFVPDARDAPSARRRGIGVYEVVGALVDVDLFRRLRVRGESRGPDGINDLLLALRLVSGRPFQKLRLGGWGWLLEGDRLDLQMECAIVDVAHVVVTHSLHAGELDLAEAAAAVALTAAPDEEVPRLDLAAVLEAQGHQAEAERLIREDVCNRSDDNQAPVDLPTRTERIIDARQRRRRNAR